MSEIKLKIFLTNWINIVGIFLTLYLFVIVSELVKMNGDIQNSLTIGFIGGLLGLIFYGSIFWISFILAMFLLDMFLMNASSRSLHFKLALEWVVVSSPFLYWFIEYTEWIFLIAIIAFAFTQFFRGKKIITILESSPHNN